MPKKQMKDEGQGFRKKVSQLIERLTGKEQEEQQQQTATDLWHQYGLAARRNGHHQPNIGVTMTVKIHKTAAPLLMHLIKEISSLQAASITHEMMTVQELEEKKAAQHDLLRIEKELQDLNERLQRSDIQDMLNGRHRAAAHDLGPAGSSGDPASY